MPLDVRRLRDSDIAAIDDAEAFRAAVVAWCVAWHQVPAASLPDDDASLCKLLIYGRDLDGWRRLREAGALRGFRRCGDGRLYHVVVAEKANEAWGKKQAFRERSRRANDAKRSRYAVLDGDLKDTNKESIKDTNKESLTAPTRSHQGVLKASLSSLKGEGEGEGKKESESHNPFPSSQRGPDFETLPPAAKTPRGTRLTDDWQPRDQERLLARSLRVDCDKAAAEFRDYWLARPGKDGVKLDWNATFRNRLRECADRGRFLVPAQQARDGRAYSQMVGGF